MKLDREGTDDQNARGINSYVWSCLPTIRKLDSVRRILVKQALCEVSRVIANDANTSLSLTTNRWQRLLRLQVFF